MYHLSPKLLSAAACLGLCVLPHATARAQQAMTQGEWMSQMLRSMGMDENELPPDSSPERMAEILTRNTRQKITAESYESYTKNSTIERQGQQWLNMSGGPGTVFYTIFVPRPTKYMIRSRTESGVQFWTVGKNPTVILSPDKDSSRLQSIGVFSLEAGYNRVSLSMSSDGRVSFFEVVPPLQSPIQPLEGWRPGEPLTYGGKAVTMIRALDLEHRLPDDATFKLNIDPTAYVGSYGKVNRGSGEGGSRLEAGGSAEVAYDFRVQEAGVYVVRIQSSGVPNKTLMNGYMLGTTVSPAESGKGLPRFILYTGWVEAGTYRLLLGLDQGTALGGIALDRKRSRVQDYFDLLKAVETEAGAEFTATNPTDLVSRDVAFNNLEKVLKPEFKKREGALVAQVARKPGAGVASDSSPSVLPSEKNPCGDSFRMPLSPVIPVCQ